MNEWEKQQPTSNTIGPYQKNESIFLKFIGLMKFHKLYF